MVKTLNSRRFKMLSGSKAFEHGKGNGGFSLIEILIAIFLAGVISAAIYTLYNNFFIQTRNQDMVVEAQQNLRAAIDGMEREFINTGYSIGGATSPITSATANSIEFSYKDPNPAFPTYKHVLKVSYALQTDAAGVQYLARTQTDLTATSTPSTNYVIPYVQSLNFSYYDINGNLIPPGSLTTQTCTGGTGRDCVRFLTVNIVARTKNNASGTNAPKYVTLETTIKLRNIGAGSIAQDTTPPAAPVGVQVRDPGLCGRLNLKWTQNTEGDLAGYRVYYGIAPGTYTGVINIPASSLSGPDYICSTSGASIQCTISPIAPSNPALAYTPSFGGVATTYYIALKAYDISLNASPYSAEVSGNPVPSNSVFDTGANDSTINPTKPPTVTGLTAVSGNRNITLNWTAYNTIARPDVVGFRVYRSKSPFTTFPISSSFQIAGENTVTASAASYVDNDASLIGCTMYYYAVAPVNCDGTLVTNDTGSDAVANMYVVTDYAATCGDGTSSCTPGTGFSPVTGSNTKPQKTTPPTAPTLSARAGYQRVAISLTQPPDADFSQTCIYGISGTTPPALTSTKDALGCFTTQTPPPSQTTGTKLYENNGVFPVATYPQNQSISFWNNSLDYLASVPSLHPTINTFTYTAIAFDTCGNASPASSAVATTVTCGEDPAGKPPAPTTYAASACAGPVTLTWSGLTSNLSQPSSAYNPYDLAGYRLARSAVNNAWGSATLLNPSAPFWGASYDDSTVTEGGTYYYIVAATDCPYEMVNPTTGAIISDMANNVLHPTPAIGPVYPGRIDRDQECAGSGTCTKSLHREVLTGVTLDSSGNPSPAANLRHNTVTLFLNNTSAGTMTITGASVSWVNSAAFLNGITVGGGRSPMGAITTSVPLSATTVVTGNPPYNSAVSNVALTTSQAPAGARYVPITFDFRNASGNPIGMRQDQLLITLNVKNDSTNTTSCVSYLTVPQTLTGISVPYGPFVTATQQDQPANPTFGYAVPGPTGANMVSGSSLGPVTAGSSLNVNISANIGGSTINENTGLIVPVTSAKLYYAVTANTVTIAPSSGYTAVNMTNSGGNIWTGQIPANNNQRIWYYLIAQDSDGNWSRDPSMSSGAYVYDQKPFNACDVTPNAPTPFTGAQVNWNGTTGNVALSWTAPTTYSNGATINTLLDTIKYRVYNGSGTQLNATDLTATSFTDTTALVSGAYIYTVKAVNSCASPGPNISVPATTSVCEGSSGRAIMTVSPASIHQGDSYTVNITDCWAQSAGYSASVVTINSTPAFLGFSNKSTAPGSFSPTIAETGAGTATFPVTIGTTSSSTDSTKLQVLTSDTITVTYQYASPTSQTISVVTTTPKAPATLSGSVSGSNVTLNWPAVTQNTDNSAITNLAGYNVYEKVCSNNNCTGSGNPTQNWFLRTSVGSGTTSTTVAKDFGTGNNVNYFFYVTAINNYPAGSPYKESSPSPTYAP